MLPEYELDDADRIDAHDYAHSHRLLKDFDDADFFIEPSELSWQPMKV